MSVLCHCSKNYGGNSDTARTRKYNVKSTRKSNKAEFQIHLLTRPRVKTYNMSHRNHFDTSPPSTPTSPSPSPTFSSCELPTPRSSTKSRVSEALPSHIAGNDKLLEFQSLTKPEPIRLLHITSPSPDFQVGSSPSRWHEDVVETVKAGLKELQADAVHVHKFSISLRGR